MFIRPCEGRITSRFQQARLDPVEGKVVRPHWGTDFGSDGSTRINAAASGKVRVSKMQDDKKGFGNYIIITHANGWETVYAHLKKRLVSAGQTVKQGQQIGVKGSTGNSTGVHLHFEISLGKWSNQYTYNVDPMMYLPLEVALKLGDKGPNVENMQKLLVKIGYLKTVDGSFGPLTESAVKSYQNANKLVVDGKAGPATMAALIKANEPKKTVADVPPKEEIRMFKPTRKIFKDETQDLFRLAREADIFSSDDHEKKVVKGEMPLDDAIGAIATIVKRVHFDKNK